MLASLIEKHGQAEVERMVGVSYWTIFRWKRGDYPIPAPAQALITVLFERYNG